MTPSENCLGLIRFSESLRLKAYPDTGNIWTNGYGHTRGVRPGDVCTREQAEQWLRDDVTEAVNRVKLALRKSFSLLNQNQFDALVSFAFNVAGFSTSTLVKLCEQGDFVGAAAQFPRWVYDNGRKQPGLVIRRDSERALFERP